MSNISPEITAPVGSAEGDKPQPSENTQQAAVTDIPTKEAPMVIDRLRVSEDGSVNFVMSLTKDQTYVLVNFAVMALISQGLAIFQDEPFEEPPKQEASPDGGGEEVSLTIGKQLH